MRSDSLKKELVTKDYYVKELEDIIVKKEATICELVDKQKEDEAAKLKADKEVKKAEEALKVVKDELKDVNSRLAHQEDVKKQREDVKKQRENLEKKTAELQESSKHLESLEEELETFKRKKEKAEDGLKAANEKIGQVSRVKLASQKVVEDFKSANKELQRNWDVSQVT